MTEKGDSGNKDIENMRRQSRKIHVKTRLTIISGMHIIRLSNMKRHSSNTRRP